MATAKSKYEKGDYFYEKPYIHTISGRFYLHDPRFDAGDMAHSMSMLCRFNGHTRRFYSVAEHCLLVAMLMHDVTGGDPFEGLMHDACESYLSDIPTPFKRLLPDWEKFDVPLELAMRKWAGLPPEMSEHCKRADKIALFIEAYHLIPERGADFIDTGKAREVALSLIELGDYEPQCLPPHTVAHMWKWAYDGFKKERP